MGGGVEARRAAVRETVAKVREIEVAEGVTRAALARIEAELIALTAKKDLFGEDEFPNPEPGQPAKLYLLSEDADGRFPVYLTCANPGGNVRPHNHGTWAVVAGLSGIEANTFYARVAGGTEPGPAEIELARRVEVRDGESVSMLPDDIHSVATPGDQPRRHFHMYGISLENLPRRLAWDVDAGTCAYMEINPKIVRVPHA
jgi:predicted metal-dependent enzyme (double-stranded beta helix superfamily)